MKIQIDDAAALSMFKKIAEEIPKAMEEVISNAGAIALTEARNRVPVDTGALKGSLTLEVNLNGESSEAVVGSVLEYAPTIEYGDSSRPPKPFMQPAMEVARDKMMEVAKAVLNQYG